MAARGGLVLTAAAGPRQPSAEPSDEELEQLARTALRETFGEEAAAAAARPPPHAGSASPASCLPRFSPSRL